MRLRRLLAPAVLALALVVAPSGPASAAVTTAYQGKSCVGSQVLRCAWINYDSTNNRMRAYGEIRDAAGGSNYDVALYGIWVDEYSAGRWVERDWVYYASDGWHAESDLEAGELLSCVGSRTYRVRMDGKWRAAGTTGNGTYEMRTSKTYTC
ncbi:hypothetical protein [Cellulomonas endophytica]|uniref:hypothetical protein n=1 Tax=Cellulomonas endophytica TaxID=2494735 RepID=UPI0010134D6D|nr:hypothetical protein [Cellulomonas endophytica]